MESTHDPDGRRLPIKLDSTSNGEYEPIPLEPVHREARHEAMVAATANARRLGLKRRQFLVSACGAATALLGMNTAYARAGRKGGYYDVPQLAAVRASCRVPLIASGGAGTREHFADVFNRARVDGALAASVFHSAAIEIGELKRYLATAGIAVRPVN